MLPIVVGVSGVFLRMNSGETCHLLNGSQAHAWLILPSAPKFAETSSMFPTHVLEHGPTKYLPAEKVNGMDHVIGKCLVFTD